MIQNIIYNMHSILLSLHISICIMHIHMYINYAIIIVIFDKAQRTTFSPNHASCIFPFQYKKPPPNRKNYND